MARQRPLSDAEIARKFEIPIGVPGFELARRFARSNRPDNTICEVPEMLCPHCAQTFQATYHDLCADEPEKAHEIGCPECDRIIHVVRIEIKDEHDPESDVLAYLSTHSPETD